jgi:hypothetical protein
VKAREKERRAYSMKMKGITSQFFIYGIVWRLSQLRSVVGDEKRSLLLLFWHFSAVLSTREYVYLSVQIKDSS